MQKIKRYSRLLSLSFYISCWVYPIIQALSAFFKPEYIFSLMTVGKNFNWDLLSMSHRCILFAIYCIPLFITINILYHLAKLFRLYEQGSLFEIANIKHIRAIGLYMLLGQLLQIVYQPLMSLALTFNQPVGQRIISLSFGSADLASLLTAFIIFTAALIVGEARQLKQEVQLTV
jgi:hypothetical protein